MARATGISEATIGRLENGYGILKIQDNTRDKLLTCFEREGIGLIPETGDARGPGVTYGKYPGRIVA